MEKEKLLKQMEFYFSDANLRRDKFLSALVRGAADGMVKLEVLLTFNRVKKFMGLSKDIEASKLKSKENIEALAAVVADSKTLKLNDSKTSVARVEAYKDSRREVPAQTVRVTGLPKDATLEKLETFFKDLVGEEKVAYVQMIRRKSRDSGKSEFKGLVHVEMGSVDAAKELSAKTDVKYGEDVLTLQLVEEYLKDKERLLVIKGLKGKVSVEQIKNALGDSDPKLWVYYMRGDEEAIIEFPTLAAAEKCLAVLQSNIADLQNKVVENTHDEMKKKEVKVEAVLVEGAELEKYTDLANKRKSHKKRKAPPSAAESSKKVKQGEEEKQKEVAEEEA